MQDHRKRVQEWVYTTELYFGLIAHIVSFLLYVIFEGGRIWKINRDNL